MLLAELPVPRSSKHFSNNWRLLMSSNHIYTKIKSTEYFLSKAIARHGNRYDYSLVEYIGTKVKVPIICKIHGVFMQTPDNHFIGRGCPKCRCVIVADITRNSIEYIISNFISAHGDTYTYDYEAISKTYTSNISKIPITCKLHGIFISSYRNHFTRKYGCPKCKKISRDSISATSWLNSLNNPNLIFEYTLPEYTRRRVDAYDPTTNTIYQFHGSYWHSDLRVFSPNDLHKKLKISHLENNTNSSKKDEQLLSFGYNLIIMWEYDWIASLKMIKDSVGSN